MAVGKNRNIFGRIGTIGYNAKRSDEYNRKTVVTNNLIVVSLALSIFLASLFYYQQAYKLFIFEGVAAIIFGVCLVLSAFKKVEASKIIGLLLANASMFGFFTSIGDHKSIALVITTLAVAPLVMFESTKIPRTIFFIMLPIAAYYLLGVIDYNVIGLEELSPDLKIIVFRVLFIASVACITFCILYLARQKRADNLKAEERQNLFTRIAEMTHNLIYIYDVNTDAVIYSNDKMFTWMGYDEAKVKAINTPFLRRNIHPEDLKTVEQNALTLLKSKEDKAVETIYRIKNAAEEYVWVRNHSQVFERSKDGRVKLVLGVSEDITEKVMEDEQLFEVHELQNNILGASSYAIMSCDVHGTFTLFNKAAEEMFGYTADEMVGKNSPAILLLQEELEAEAIKLSHEFGIAVAPNLDVLTQRPLRGMPETAERTYLRKDGSQHPALVTVSTLRDKHGNITGFLGMSRDITARKQKEVLLKKAKDMAEEASRAKSQFLANMGHEIRTPLNAILGMTDLTLESPLNDEQREYLGYVRDSGTNLLHVINDILDYSKIESGVFELFPVDFNIYDTINAAIKAEGTLAYQKNLDFHYTIDSRIPALLFADPVRVSQVVTNILGNAVKFTDRGTVWFKAELVDNTDDVAEIKFTVTDSGIGIPHDKQEFIFQAFAQIDDSHKRVYQGTGLGLSLAQRLTEQMKGRIKVISDPGKGSTFIFSLKLKISSLPVDVLPDFKHIRLYTYTDNSLKTSTYQNIADIANLQCIAVEAVEVAQMVNNSNQNILLIDIGEDEKILVSLAEKLNRPEYRDVYKVLAISRKIDNELKDALEEVGFSILPRPLVTADIAAIATKLPPKTGYLTQQPGIRIESKLIEAMTSPLKVLVVEDNDINRMLTARVVEKMGYRVETVINGKQAIDRFALEQFDMIIMDIQMPEMDGMEATYHIRAIDAKNGTHTPIIAMTAHAMKGDREKYIEAGMDAYISKPFDKKILEERIVELQKQYVLQNRQISEPKQDVMGKIVANGKVDLTYLEDLLHGNNVAIREVLGMFIMQAPQLLGEMNLAYNRGQLNQLSSLTHKLKGTLVAIGVNGQDLERLKNIERQSKEEVDNLAIKPLLDTSTDRLLGIVDELKEYVTGLED